MMKTWHMAVLIPARDEEALLPRCLESVAAAMRALPKHVSCDVVVVSDASTDATADLARSILGHSGAVLESQYGCVGNARAAAAAVALDRAAERSIAPKSVWLANTDADCAVPEDWLLRQLTLAERGCEAVTGIVDVDCFDEHAPWVAQRFRETYTLHADGTHPHVHAANMGVRGDVFLHAGGWTPLESAEDHHLWNRLLANKAECVADAGLMVWTSGRRVGRAPAGFAGALAAHNFLPLQTPDARPHLPANRLLAAESPV